MITRIVLCYEKRGEIEKLRLMNFPFINSESSGTHKKVRLSENSPINNFVIAKHELHVPFNFVSGCLEDFAFPWWSRCRGGPLYFTLGVDWKSGWLGWEGWNMGCSGVSSVFSSNGCRVCSNSSISMSCPVSWLRESMSAISTGSLMRLPSLVLNCNKISNKNWV